MRALIPALALCLFATAAAAAPEKLLLAQDGGTVTIQDLTESNKSGMSLDQAVRKVRRETGGRILSAKTIKKEGVWVHRIKVLTPDKRVMIYEIDR